MTEPAHSPLGASGASRWMTCPGSVALAAAIGGGGDDENEWSAEGSAAHDLAAYCLRHGEDAWERVGEHHYDRAVTADMADHVQVYLNHCRKRITGELYWIEHRITSTLHNQMLSTLDFAALHGEGHTLYLEDLKYGAGIAVEVVGNPQLKYYAFALMQSAELFDGVAYVSTGIVQPRCDHPDGPVRSHKYTAEEIHEWGHDELIPAMRRTARDHTLDPGAHCRFCPARFVCPALQGIFAAMCQTPPTSVRQLDDVMLGLAYRQIEVARIFIRALETEALNRLQHGRSVEGLKLVDKRADRVYRDGAETALHRAFGEAIYTQPGLKSPAQLEKLGPEAKALVKKWAYTPKTGQTVSLSEDRRPGIKRATMKERFAHIVKADTDADDW